MNASFRRIVAGSALAFVHHLCVAQQVMCGLGPPPGSPDFEAWTTKTEQQRRNLGYLLVCDGNLDRYRFDAEATDDNTVRRILAFDPRNLDKSKFSELEFLGSIADGFGDRGAAMYRRVFRGTNEEVITLLEFPLYGGARVRRMRNDGIVRIRDTDAQLTVVQTASGRGFAQLAWQEESTYFEVTIDQGTDNGRSRERLIRFAESIPSNR